MLSELVIEAVEGVEEIFESLDVLYALELSDACSDVLTVDLIQPCSDDR